MQPLFSITIPLPLKVSFNAVYAGIHWAKRKEHADLFHQAFLEHRKLKIDPKHFPVAFHYRFTFKNKPLDASNCAYMVKLLEDGMVKSGIIPGDSIKYVHSTAQQSRKGSEDSVRIIAVAANMV